MSVKFAVRLLEELTCGEFFLMVIQPDIELCSLLLFQYILWVTHILHVVFETKLEKVIVWQIFLHIEKCSFLVTSLAVVSFRLYVLVSIFLL